METMWYERLKCVNWSDRASKQIAFCLAESTKQNYNGVIQRLWDFCKQGGHSFPPTDTATIANFYCHIADSSQKPRSQLKTSAAALSWMFKSRNLPDISQDFDLQHLIISLVKSGTSLPMQRSQVMPVDSFTKLFRDWPDNGMLSVKQLRLKAICLLSLVAMLRPSDIAPKAVIFNHDTLQSSNVVFSTDHIVFNEDGSMCIVFHGIKNDSTRTGFKVSVSPASDKKVCPVDALHEYIIRTECWRPNPQRPVFLSLKAPFKPIDAATVGKILQEAIKLAGLSSTQFTPKCFRPTGATLAVEHNHDPDIVMKVGRWKTRSVFFEHYVHSKTPSSFTKDILNV